MLSKTAIKGKIAAVSKQLRSYGVRRVGLFGSYVNQKARVSSDIDIFIDFYQDQETFDNFMSVCDTLDAVFAGYSVDIVTAGGLSPHIGPHILKSVDYVQIAN